MRGIDRSGIIRLVFAGSLAAAAIGLATPGPAAASCDGPVPSFRQFARSANRIVIGTVTAVDGSAPWQDDEGRSSRFTLHVEYVVRGEAGATLAVRDAPFLGCADHIIMARVGDEIALAFGVPGLMGPDDPFVATVPAWIRGTPIGDGEQITVGQVFRLLGKPTPPPTSTGIATAADEPRPDAAARLLGAILATVAAAAMLVRRRTLRPLA